MLPTLLPKMLSDDFMQRVTVPTLRYKVALLEAMAVGTAVVARRSSSMVKEHQLLDHRPKSSHLMKHIP